MDSDSETVVHTGGCHCKSVRWKAVASPNVVAWDCNCSDCYMRANTHFVMPAERFELLGDSDKFITTYTFGTHTAKHTFCKVCGITSFYYPRSNPDGVAVSYKCVDPGTLKSVEIKHIDGRNWEESVSRSASNLKKKKKEIVKIKAVGIATQQGNIWGQHLCLASLSSIVKGHSYIYSFCLHIQAEMNSDSETVVHNGGCHCKSVRWKAVASPNVVACTCYCSHCLMRGSTLFAVPAEKFELLGDSDKFITAYTSGSHTTK